MTFVTILKAVYSTYHVDFCYVADHIGVDDEEVLRWERGESKPDEHALHHFSVL